MKKIRTVGEVWFEDELLIIALRRIGGHVGYRSSYTGLEEEETHLSGVVLGGGKGAKRDGKGGEFIGSSPRNFVSGRPKRRNTGEEGSASQASTKELSNKNKKDELKNRPE